MLLTGSNDLQIGFHRMSEDKAIEKTVMRMEVEDKINDIKGLSRSQFFVADLSGTISKFTIRY